MGAGGEAVSANSVTFPAAIKYGISMTVGVLEPCGMNTPHTHPRAAEMLFSVNGTIQSGFLDENGARFVASTVPAGTGTIYPQGAIHFQQNLECDPITFVSGLNSEDPGVLSFAQRYFGLPPEVVAASLGDLGIIEVAGLESKIPDNFALGIQSCLDRCGIKRGDQPTTQRQPRVAGNELPTGFSGPPPPKAVGAVVSSSSSPSSSGNKTFTPLVIGLIVAVGVLGLGYVVVAIAYFVRRKRGDRGGGMPAYVRTGEAFAPLGAAEQVEFRAERHDTPYDEVKR